MQRFEYKLRAADTATPTEQNNFMKFINSEGPLNQRKLNSAHR